jgi:PAS domain S-box-containing protein
MVQALRGLPDNWGVVVLTALLAAAVLLLLFHRYRLRRLKSLLVSERRLTDLIDRSPLGIVVYRDRALLYANALSLSLFGMPSMEKMGRRHFLEFFAPEERPRILGYIVAREKGEAAPSSYEVMALKADGQPFPMAVQVSQVELRDGPAVIMFLEDASERRAARAALEKSERDYRGLFENAHDAILIFEPEGERILDANERASEMYGVPREELLGKSLEAFSANVAEGKRRIEEIVADGVLTGYQTAHRRQDGSLILLDVNASMVDYGGRRAILSIQRDITDRVRAEEALRESEEEYRLLVEGQTDIVVKLTPSARLTYASPSFCRTFGRSLEELVGNEVGPLIHEEDLQQTLKAFAALKNPPHRTAVEHRLRTKDGWRWFSCSYNGLPDEEGNLSGIVGTGQDVTERKAVEDALRESEQRFRALTDSSTASVLIYQDAKICYVNRSMETLLGYKPSELPGMNLGTVLHPDYRDLLLKRAHARQRGEPVLSQYEAPLMRKDGTTRWLLISAARILYQGNPAGILAAFDVTEKRDAEERLRQSAHEIRAIFSALPDLYFRLDQEGRILDWRAGHEQDLYLMPDQIQGKLIQEALPPEVSAPVHGALKKVLATRKIEVVDYTLSVGGETQVFEAHLAPLFHNQAVAVVRNITERRRAQTEIEAWKRRFDLVSVASGQVVYDYDVPSGAILWSGSVEQVLGYSPSEMGNLEAWSERIHPEDRAEALKLLEDAEKACTPYDVTYRFQHKGGYFVHVHDRGFFIKGASGLAERMVGMMADVTDARHVQEAMRRSEERFRRTFDLSPVGAVMVSLEGQFLRCNSAFCRFLGYPEEELAGKHFLEVTFSEDLETGQEAIRAIAEESIEQAAIQKRYVRKDGHVVWGEVTIRLVPETEDYPAHFLTIIQDITERQRAESILQQSEAKFRSLYEQMRDGFVVVTPEGRIIECNEAYCALTGYTREELVHLTYTDLTPERWHEMERRHLEEEILKTGASSLYEKEYRRKDGSLVPIEVRAQAQLGSGGKALFMWALVRDITERKRAEEAVAASEARLRLIVDNVQEIIYSVTFDGGPLSSSTSFVSPQVTSQIGYTPEEFYADPGLFVSLLHPDDQEVARDVMERFIADGEGGTRQYRLRHMATGEYRWMEDRVVLVKDGTGAVVGFQGVARDVTERKRAEAALLESEGRLRKILELSPISMALVGMDGTIEYINRKAVETFGYSHEDIPTMDRWWVQAYPDEAYRKEVVATWTGLVMAAVAQNREIEGRDYRLTCKDGTVKFVFIFGVPVAGKVFVIFQDVTDRKAAEEALRARLEQHRALVENARAIILQWTPDLTVTFWNDFATEFFGFTEEEMLGASLLDTIIPRADMAGRNLEAMIRGIAVDVNRFAANINENLTKDGRHVWVAWTNRPLVDAEGHLTGILSVGTDITELKRAEGALAESEKRLRVIYDNVQEIVYYLQPGSGAAPVVPSFVNRQIEALLGYTVEEYLQGFETWKTVIHPDDFERLAQGARTLLSDLRPRAREFRVLHKLTGEYHWIENMLLPDLDASGRPLGYFGVARDVTERRRAEDMLRLRNRQLMAVAVSADAMGRFLETQKATKAICDAAIDAFGATMAWVGLVVPESTEITPLSSSGQDEGYTEGVKVRWDLSERAMGPTGRAVKTRKPQIMQVTDPAFAPWRDAALRRGYQTVSAVPILHGDEVRGVLTIYSDRPDAFGPEIFDIFEVFARQCAMVLVNAALYEEARNTIQELWNLNEQLKGKS